MRLRLFICLLLFGITLAVYWPTRHFDIIYYDDPLFVTENTETASGLNWHSFVWAMTSITAANWHPVTSLSFVLTHQFFGINPGAEHLVNAVVHAVNAVLLFLALMQLWKTAGADARSTGIWRCAVVAAIFALHPLRVESVCWITERKDVLFGFFFFIAILAYAKYAELKLLSPTLSSFGEEREKNQSEALPRNPILPAQGKEDQDEKVFDNEPPHPVSPPGFVAEREKNFRVDRAWIWYLVALIAFALGFMSKAMIVTLPFVLLLLDFWPLNRVSNVRWPRLLLEKAPFFAMAIVFSVLTFWLQQTHAAVMSLDKLSLFDRVESATLSYVHYLEKFFWPAKLAVIYPFHADFHIGSVLLAAFLLLVVSAVCIGNLRLRPYLAVGWFWFLGTMLPVIGLVQVGETAMADRYTYLPLIGITIALVWLAADWAEYSLWRKFLLLLGTVFMLAALVQVTSRQIQFWRNTVALFEHTIEVTDNNPSAEFILATGLENEGKLRQAAVHYRMEAALSPDDSRAHYRLAVCLDKMGRYADALAEMEPLVSAGYKQDDFAAHIYTADILAHLGRYEEAESHLESALRLKPDSVEAMNNLAWILATCPDKGIRDGNRAVEFAEEACASSKYKQTTCIGTLAAAYAEAGRFDDAIAAANRAIAVAEHDGDKKMAEKNRELLGIYEEHKPYHESRSDQP